MRIVKKQEKSIWEEEGDAEKRELREEPAANYGLNQGPNRVRKGVRKGVNQGVESAPERGVEDVSFSLYIINNI